MNKKSVLVLLCVFMLVSTSIFGTLAYLTDTDTTTNTFTVGQVHIDLDETNVDDGLIGPVRDKKNEYHLLPGQTYIKDPVVTVEAESEDAYIRILVEVDGIEKLKAAMPAADFADFYNGDVFLLEKLCNGWDPATWFFEKYENGVYEFRYKEVVPKSATATKLPALFKTITIPGEVDNDGVKNLADIKIIVIAHAIQADGFGDANAAWAVFGAQHPGT